MSRTYATSTDGLIVRKIEPESFIKDGKVPRFVYVWLVFHRGTMAVLGRFRTRKEAFAFADDLKGLGDFSQPTYHSPYTKEIHEVLKKHNQNRGMSP